MFYYLFCKKDFTYILIFVIVYTERERKTDRPETGKNWNCIDEQTGKPLGFYYLANKVESRNEDLMNRVIEAIKTGEDDHNKDLELYLTIRDTFEWEKARDLVL